MRLAFAGRQRGAAALVLLLLLVAGGSFFLLRSLNAATWRAERHRVTQEALVSAKEALVARAVADDNRPGSLPCPDTDDDGNAELFVGTACPSYIGRLPFKTLDLPDLRDSNGERLWYALSPTHRDHPAAEPINSNTAGQLNVTGMLPASNVLAVLIAPGSALIRSGAASVQDRSCIVGTNCNASLTCTTSPASSTPKCNPVNYLDIAGGTDNALGSTTSPFAAAAESATFNDRVLAIVSDDIMPLVEKRVGREFGQRLREHYDAWQSATSTGFYPWAAPFIDPTSSPVGTSGTTEGLLPTSTAAATWTAASANCAGVGTTELTCTGLVVPLFSPLFSMWGTVGNVGTAFFEAPSASNVTVVSSLLLLGGVTSSWTVNSATQTLNFSYSGTALALGLVDIRVRAPAPSSWTTTSWVTSNRWSELAYYALSPAYAINGSGTCGTCLTVANTPGNKEAIVVMTGRALSGQPGRPVTPPAALAAYLEGANLSSADYAFEQNLRTTLFNDQPSVVRP